MRVAHAPRGSCSPRSPGASGTGRGSPEDLPAVGDWVALRLRAGRAARARSRPSCRGAPPSSAGPPGDRTVAQVLAANVDTVFLVMGLDADFNPRRLERALVLAWESGAQPVVLLNKADLCDDVDAAPQRGRAGRRGVPGSA